MKKRHIVVRLILAPIKLVLMIFVATPIAMVLILMQETEMANKVLDAVFEF